MSEESRSFGLTINKLIRSYREMAGLSQNELSTLSRELYDQGIMSRYYTQPAIARYESDPYDGKQTDSRVKRLYRDTIDELAILFEYALKNAGYEEVIASDLAEFLQEANDQNYDPRRASAFALETDALMVVFPVWLRKMAEDDIRTILQTLRAVYTRYSLTGKNNEK